MSRGSLGRRVRRMGRLVRPLALLGLVFVLAGWVGRKAPEVLLSHVAPWSVGVRQDNFGGGLDPVDLAPGLHGGVPGLRLVHAVDMRGRLTLFGATLGEPGPLVAVAPPLDIRTTSNQTAQVDLALAWRIRPGAGHRVVEGALEGLLPARVADRASKVLEVQLAALASEEWFDAERRARLTADIEPLLAAELEDLHVELTGLHLAKVRFPTEFERKLQEKQVSHQTSLLFDATARVDQAQAEVGRLENQTAAEEQKLLAEWLRERGEKRALFDLEQAALAAETAAHIQRVQSEAEAAHQGALAQGQLAVALAEGIGKRLHLQALDGPGGQVYLAREAASNLKVEEVWLDSRDPDVPSMLDLDELALLLFGGGATIPEQLAVVD